MITCYNSDECVMKDCSTCEKYKKESYVDKKIRLEMQKKQRKAKHADGKEDLSKLFE